MKKTESSLRPRRLALASETIRSLRAFDLARAIGGSDAKDTLTQGSFVKCTFENSCDTQPTCRGETDTCWP